LLGDIPTSIYALKMLRPGQMSPLPLGYATVFKTRIISLLQVMHTAKYPEVGASYKNCHTDIYLTNKTVVSHAAKC